MAKPLLEKVLHELNILHGLWVTDSRDIDNCFRIDLSPLIEQIQATLSETPPRIDELVEALQVIRGEPQAQLDYLKARGLNPPKSDYGQFMTAEVCEWAGDYETDARHTYPNQWRLVSAVIQAALAQHKKEVGDAEV